MTTQGKVITLDVTDLAFDGKAVAHLDGKVVFLKGGLPGETVEAEIVSSKPRYDQGVVRRIIKKSDQRIEPRCGHFGQCGGCTWQDLSYEQQLTFKKKQVQDCLKRLGGLEQVEVKEVLGVDDPFWYRNKMEFSFHEGIDQPMVLGLHERGHFDRIFDLDKCWLQSELSNEIVAWVRQFVTTHDIPAYNVGTHTGYMRFLMIRQTARTDQVMVNLVTNRGLFPSAEAMVAGMTERFGQVTTIVHNQTGKVSNVAVGEVEEVLYGPGFIEEQLFDRRFRIRANSFFQTNSLQAQKLYGAAFEMLQSEPTDRVLDLYCGAGTIGILLADKVESVGGVELVDDAVAAARENAALNGIANISFHQGRVRDYLKGQRGCDSEFSTLIIDPPRAGLHPKAARRIIEMQPTKLLYISCNPATFARDAKVFALAGYHLPTVQPVDMFPHTMHIELVGRFYRN